VESQIATRRGSSTDNRRPSTCHRDEPSLTDLYLGGLATSSGYTIPERVMSCVDRVVRYRGEEISQMLSCYDQRGECGLWSNRFKLHGTGNGAKLNAVAKGEYLH
jgi:hypothetical protein